MGRYLIKLDGKYLEWSTVVDAPVTDGMTLEELKASTFQRKGEHGLKVLAERLERVEETGISAHYYKDVDELITHNRAGEGETCLTKEQIIAFYVNHTVDVCPRGSD